MIYNEKILKNLKIFAGDFLPMTAGEFEKSSGFRRHRLLIFRPEQNVNKQNVKKQNVNKQNANKQNVNKQNVNKQTGGIGT